MPNYTPGGQIIPTDRRTDRWTDNKHESNMAKHQWTQMLVIISCEKQSFVKKIILEC